MEPYFATGFGTLATLLLAIAVTQLRALSRTAVQHGEELIKITTVLTGATGDNGINGEVKQLRSRVDEIDRRIADRRHDDRRHA